MAYLNADERAALLHDLTKMNFNQARGKLRSLNGTMTIFRNVQLPGEWITRYKLRDKGTVVTLYEHNDVPDDGPANRHKAKYDLFRVVVEATPDNQS